MAAKKRILFIHYRVGERDGVSLEIEKRARLFEEMGHEVFYISGRDGIKRKNSFIVQHMELGETAPTFLRDGSFYTKMFDEHVMLTLYSAMENDMQKRITEIFNQVKPDLVFVHNLFSHAYNLPATTAVINVLDRFQTPTIVLSHDFWFERPQFHHPKYFFIEEILKTLPPQRPYILQHQVINSNAHKQLLARRQIDAHVNGDSFDFVFAAQQPMDARDEVRQKLGIKPNDIVVLHATRITARKAIENAILYVHELSHVLKEKKQTVMLGRTYDHSSQVMLLFSNFIEADAKHYAQELQSYAQKLGVVVRWEEDAFEFYRSENELHKKFSFWDSYSAADIVTYTSIQEGYGNQFLEAVAFRKPLVLFEYPVFKEDIKKEGYYYISLGSEVFKRNGFHLIPRSTAERAAKETVRFLSDVHELTPKLMSNYKTAKKLHDESVLQKELTAIVQHI